MDLKSAHSQEFYFQEPGEVDRFFKMGTHFQERSGSLENGLVLHGQASGYTQGTCGFLYLLQWSKSMTRSHDGS